MATRPSPEEEDPVCVQVCLRISPLDGWDTLDQILDRSELKELNESHCLHFLVTLSPSAATMIEIRNAMTATQFVLGSLGLTGSS